MLNKIQLLILTVSLFTYSNIANAGAMFPKIVANLSENGEYLVFVDFTYENFKMEEKTLQRVKKVTYKVLWKENFLNSKLRSNSKHFTANAGGIEVTIPFQGQWLYRMSYDVPFVSNDGDYLVLVTTAYARAEAEAIKVYKHNWDSEAETNSQLVKNIKIRELWTKEEIAERKVGDFIDDHTPVWFKDGKFDYSEDGKKFVFITHTGRRVVINLSSGDVIEK